MDHGVVEGSCPSLALGAESCTAEALGSCTQDALRVGLRVYNLVPRLTRDAVYRRATPNPLTFPYVQCTDHR